MSHTITKIEKQTKRDRYNIYLDGVYGFSVDSQSLVNHNLTKEQEISGKELDKIKSSDEEVKAYNRATLILSYRANSESELRKKLIKNFDKSLINKVIQKLKEQNLLNDDDFAKRYAENSKKGKKLVKIELLKKGVSKNITEKALESKSNEQELENAKELAQKTLKKYKSESEIVQNKKLYEALTRKGFSYDILKEIVEDIL